MTRSTLVRLAASLLLVLAAFTAAAQQDAANIDIDGKLKVPDAAQFVGAPRGTPLTGEQLFHETARIGGLLRCPVCQGMAVADSPAEMAVNMKGQVRELVARGYTEEQILRYFELSYGQFVLLKPKFEGVTGMVWILPVIALVLGGAVVFVKLRSLEKGPVAAAAAPAPEAPVSPQSSQPDRDDDDDPYLAQVRDLVGGKK